MLQKSKLILKKIGYFIIYMIMNISFIRMLAHVEAECKDIIPGQGHWTDDYFLYLRYLEIKLKLNK